jgi:hypothetical protein
MLTTDSRHEFKGQSAFTASQNWAVFNHSDLWYLLGFHPASVLAVNWVKLLIDRRPLLSPCGV